MSKVDENNYTEVDIKSITENSRFGELAFETSTPLLENVQEILSDFDSLDYKQNLDEESVNKVDDLKNNFIETLNKIDEYDLKSDPSQHSELEKRAQDIHHKAHSNLRNPLLWLDREVNKGTGKTEHQKQLREAHRLKEELQTEIDDLKKQKQGVQSSHGEIAAAKFGNHFEAQANHFNDYVRKWYKQRQRFFWSLLIIILLNFGAYFYLAIADITGWPGFSPGALFTVEYVIVKISLVALLSYALSFASKNYNITCQQEVLNLHRKNVAETLNNFLESSEDTDVNAEILKAGSEAMFQQHNTGYITKSDSEDGPARTLVNNVNEGVSKR